jgi:hypothetical protein
LAHHSSSNLDPPLLHLPTHPVVAKLAVHERESVRVRDYGGGNERRQVDGTRGLWPRVTTPGRCAIAGSADPVGNTFPATSRHSFGPCARTVKGTLQLPTALWSVRPRPWRTRTLGAAGASPLDSGGIGSLRLALDSGGVQKKRTCFDTEDSILAAWYLANKARCTPRTLDSVLRRCTEDAGRTGVVSIQPSDPLASPEVNQSPVGSAKAAPGVAARPATTPRAAAGRWFGLTLQTRCSAAEVQSRSFRQAYVFHPRVQEPGSTPMEGRIMHMLHLGAYVMSSKGGRSGGEDAQDTGMRNEQRHSPCVRRSLPHSPVYPVRVVVASRRSTRAMLGGGDLDNGPSVPSHGAWTLSTDSSERMREGCVRVLGAKQTVTDRARGRRAATGSFSHADAQQTTTHRPPGIPSSSFLDLMEHATQRRPPDGCYTPPAAARVGARAATRSCCAEAGSGLTRVVGSNPAATRAARTARSSPRPCPL